MSDEAFLNLGKDNSTNSGPQLTQNTQQGIIERTLHTIHTIRVYPNGDIYVNNPISWLDKKVNIVKSKKKKIVKPKKSVLQEIESY